LTKEICPWVHPMTLSVSTRKKRESRGGPYIYIDTSGSAFETNEAFDLNLPFQRSSQLGCFPIPLGLPPSQALLSGLPGHSGSARARTYSKTFIRQPCFEYTPYYIESSSLNDAASDRFATSDTDVDDALEGEREPICRVFVERMWVECGYKPGWAGVRWGEAVDERRILWGWWTNTKVVKDTNETLESTVHSHYFANSRRGGC
jgi:hypothetical protein